MYILMMKYVIKKIQNFEIKGQKIFVRNKFISTNYST